MHFHPAPIFSGSGQSLGARATQPFHTLLVSGALAMTLVNHPEAIPPERWHGIVQTQRSGWPLSLPPPPPSTRYAVFSPSLLGREVEPSSLPRWHKVFCGWAEMFPTRRVHKAIGQGLLKVFPIATRISFLVPPTGPTYARVFPTVIPRWRCNVTGLRPSRRPRSYCGPQG